jgi:hypothetical protein
VRFDSGTKAAYSTDSSNYRQVPLGVVIPHTTGALAEAVAVCHRHGAPVTHRGAGTSLGGQTTNACVVIDGSKYLDEIIEINAEEKWARVRPGVRHDQLTDQTHQKYNLTFGPDTSTHEYATFGGMIGNNSCGMHAQMAGRTQDNVEEMEVLLYDGTRLTVGPTSEEELEEIIAAGGRKSEIYEQLRDLRDEYADEIRARYPDISRRVSGYNLEELLPENDFHVARALVGTEGTCARGGGKENLSRKTAQRSMRHASAAVLLLIAVLPASLPLASHGQPTGAIRGTVVDATTQRPLPGASVALADTSRGTATDGQGRFEIAGLAPGTYTLRATFVGYAPQTKAEVRVRPSRPTQVTFELRAASESLAEVVVEASSFADESEASTSLQTIGPAAVQRTPGGQNDISRTLLSLPGVTGGLDSRSDLLVRGGGPSENAYFLDGIRIPQINHFATQGASGGALGLLNVDFIEETRFYTGGFPARYGDALSSMLAVENRDGSPESVAGDFTLGAVEAALTLDGPLPTVAGEGASDEGASNWIFSVRRSYLQFLFQALGVPIRPSYWDAQTKITHDLDADDRLTVVGVGALDDFTIAAPDEGDFAARETARRTLDNDQWSYTAGLTWRHLFEDGVVKTALSRSVTDFQFSGDTPSGETVIRNGSRETETRLRTDADLRLGPRVSLGLGGGLTRGAVETSFFERARPGTSFDEDLAFSSDLGLWRGFTYAQATTRWLGGRLTLSPGARLSATSFLDTPFYVSPRLSASFRLAPEWAVNASGGVFQQAPEYVSLAVRGENGDFVNDRLPYLRADHYIAGLEWQPTEGVRATAEGFYKDYDRYPVSASDPRLSLANRGASYGFVGAEPLRGIGDGRAYGAELFAQKKLTDRFYGLAAYTLAWSEFAGADGVLRPSSWDVRHTISLTGGYRIGKRWEIGVKWRFLSGRPYTPFDPDASAEEYDLTGRGVPDYDRLNAERVPAYHRLDVRIDRRFAFEGWNAVVYVDVQNVYDRTNVYDYRYTEDPSADDNQRAVDNVGRLPTFGFSVEW